MTRNIRSALTLASVSIVLALLAACSGSTDPRPDTRACEQTYEFGNTGCAEIHGVVLDREGRGVGGIYVQAREIAGQGTFGSSIPTTAADGRFRLRVIRYDGKPPQSGPDTVSFFVIATDPRSATLDAPATVQDTVLARVTVAPLGSVPEPAVVQLRLELP